jgi:sugar lactone lactonase YvrE
MSRVTSIHPLLAIEGGRIVIEGEDFPVDEPLLPEVWIGEARARLVHASPSRLVAVVPSGLDGGRAVVRVGAATGDGVTLEVMSPFATGLHQVDSPVFDRDGILYVYYSGTRGQHAPVSIFRVGPGGTREAFSSGVANPTSMAIDPAGQLYVSSRFEGSVFRVAPDGSATLFATDLGVACGLAFGLDGTLYVGDRSGTVFRVGSDGRTIAFATLPASVAAFHLAMSPDGVLWATGPTLSAYDALYRIAPDGTVTTRYAAFGRPQGLAFDTDGTLFVVEALAGASGLYRVPAQGDPQLVLSGPGLLGVAFDTHGTVVVVSSDTAYRLVRSATTS